MLDEREKQRFKEQLYQHLARIGKALGNARRLEIVDLLAQAEHTVESLADKTKMSVASVSQHLQVLRGARLVKVRREGTYAFYSLTDQAVLQVWNNMSELGLSHLIEIDYLMRTYFTERSTLEAISADQLLERLKKGNILLLDARPPDEYQAGHIPGALSVPTEAIAEHLKDLPQDQEIVAYCRTSYCLLSDELALILKANGYNVRILEKGMSDWQASGFPVESVQAEDETEADVEG